MGLAEAGTVPWMKRKTTWVDKRGKKREVPMELLCLGWSRTGTASLRVALWELGYSAYHGFSMFENPPDAPLMNEALRAKFLGEGRKWTREDWDAFFFDCNACIDNPGNAFAPELIAAYPEAKVIMTVRNVDDWYRSVKNTIFGPKAKPGFLPWLLETLDPATGMVFSEFRLHNRFAYDDRPWEITRKQAQSIWDEHLETVRKLVNGEQYLEFDVREGWGPLCKFLKKPIPRDEDGNEKPFPNVNDSKMFGDVIGLHLQGVLLKRLAQYVLPIIIAGFATVLYTIRH